MISVAHAAAEGGVPQFEQSMFQHQIVWAVISFAILLYLLNKYVIPAINDLLDARARKIEEDITGAERARREAEKAQAELSHQLTSSR